MEAMIKTKEKAGFCSLYSKGEEIFNAVSHIVGGGLGLVFWVVLTIFAYPSGVAIAGVSVFCFSIILLYTMSALYHFLPNGRAKGVFRIFDHCTIFLLIAGTYTPFCLIALNASPLAIGILSAEWALAAAGITMNAIAMKNKIIKILSMGAYVGMGWAIAVSFRPLVAAISTASFWLLLAGGIAYTAGIVFFALGKKVRYFHSVWHLFDLAGTVLQACSILLLLL